MRKAELKAIADPTIPDVSVEIAGAVYRLCFDFAALGAAKARLRACGVETNILQSLDFHAIDVDTLPVLFFAAAQRFHPKLDWESARKLVTMQTAPGIFAGIRAAYIGAMLPQKPNPRRAARRK